MPVTAEELRKLAESRMPRGTPTADELRELAESRKQKTEFKPFGFGIELSQPQPEKPRSPIEEVQYQKAKAQEKATNKAVGIAKFAWDIAGGPGTLFYPKNNVIVNFAHLIFVPIYPASHYNSINRTAGFIPLRIIVP
jgi:hypothetical protein